MQAVRRELGWVAEPSGLRLFWQAFLPAEAKAALLFVHGLAEHSDRYLNPFLYFAPRGFACYGFDCRGHGRSPGRRVHVDSFDDYLSDVRTVQALVAGRHRDLPLFVVGHSLGGLIAPVHALRSPAGLSGIVLSSPAFGVSPDMRPSRALVLAARALSLLWPTAPLANHVDPAVLSRDEAVVEAYRRDPAVSRRVSARWYTSVMAAMREAHSGAFHLAVPALVMAAGADRAVSTDATRHWAEKAPSDRVELVVWDGLFHELFNEPEREEVFRRMESWLVTRLQL